MKNKRFPLAILRCLILAAGIALPDLILKTHIEKTSDSQFPHPLGHSGITIHRHHNYGFAMNRAEEHPQMVRGLTSLFFALTLGHFLEGLRKHADTSDRFPLWATGFSLILGGGFSNIADRIRLGYVVDYFSFPFKRIRHIIMNIGDLGIFLGSLLIAIAGLVED